MTTTRRPGGTPKTVRRTAPSRAGSPTPARTSTNRPAAAARPRRPAEERRGPRSIKGMAILVSIFVMLAITLIPALRATFGQQSEINGLQDHIAQQRQSVAALQQEQLKWADPAYVEQQARERLKLVRPGERSFTVIDGSTAAAPDLTGGAQMAAPMRTSTSSDPWYGQLWQSVLIADTPTAASPGRGPSPAQAP